jgi:hypothetical protein
VGKRLPEDLADIKARAALAGLSVSEDGQPSEQPPEPPEAA